MTKEILEVIKDIPEERLCEHTGEFNCKDILQERTHERTGEQIDVSSPHVLWKRKLMLRD